MIRIGYCYLKGGVLSLLLVLSVNCFSQSINNWTGASSADWATAGNWSTGLVPGTGDVVQIGLSPFSNQPTVSANTQISALKFGGTKSIILTITSGHILQVTNDVTQGHSTYGIADSTTVTGDGKLLCQRLFVGNNVTSKIVKIKTTLFRSTIDSLIVNGDIILNSTTINLLSGGVGNNNSTFSLEGGVTSVNGHIHTSNQIPNYLSVLPGNKPLDKFQISTNSNTNATLKLTDSNTINLDNAAYARIDFYNHVSGTGKCVVEYAGANQLVYANPTAGLDTLPYAYQNLTIKGSGTKKVGSSAGNKLHIGGDLIVQNGTMDLLSYNSIGTIEGNFTNRAIINLGSPTFSLKGPSFFNSGSFNYGTGLILFSGSAQTLIDSTGTATTFRTVTFNNSGTKTIHLGNFAVVPKGKLNMSANAILHVDTSAILTIRSDTTGSASVTPIPAGCLITGLVNVEWFVAGSPHDLTARAYMQISSAVNHTGNTDGHGDFNLNWLTGTTNYNGAIITGTAGGGFYSTGNPTLYLFREDINTSGSSFTSGNYQGVNKINNTNINDVGTQKRFTTSPLADTTVRLHVGNGSLFFFRGNKVLNNGTTSGTKTTAPYNYPENVTFVNRGTVNQGQIQVPIYYLSGTLLSYTKSPSISNAPARGQNMIGNPYPSGINWDYWSKTDTGSVIYGPNITGIIYIYDPVIKALDAYIPDASHDKNTIYYGTGGSIASNVIPVSCSFFVFADSTASPHAASIRIREGSKFNPPDTTGFSMHLLVAARSLVKSPVIKPTTGKARSVSEQLLRMKLTRDDGKSDDMLIRFRKSANSKYDPGEDAPDIHLMDPDGNDEALITLASSSSDGIRLIINTLPLPVFSEKLNLFTDAVKSGQYQLNLYQLSNLPPKYQLTLIDKLNNTSTDLRKKATYNFMIDKNNITTYGERFQMVITLKKTVRK